MSNQKENGTKTININFYEKKKKRPKIPLVEKYRPKSLNKIMGQDHVVNILKKSLETKSFTHILFYGPPGTGKTSTIRAYAHALYGPNIYDQRVLELNASDDRGINVVREKIIGFAKLAVGNPDPDYPSPSYKIIILDEADAMTNDAQAALRAVIETSSNVTRFCFICNYINQIIDPISSRCMKFRFKPLYNDQIKQKMTEIMVHEKFMLNDLIIDKIIENCGGDIRNALISLQYMKYIHEHNQNIQISDLYQITNYLPDEIIDKVWNNYLINPNSNIQSLTSITSYLVKKCYSINTILVKLMEYILNCETITESDKCSIAIKMGQIEKRIIDGSDEYIQLLNSFAFIKSKIKKN